ncbi:hypothetical protein P7K49_014991 [Saguinus oedipus]|uniref:Uncharacterized protein n=1 Tax=Saguinus oedipus TaxID=9490 RepID=A0ABQ9V8B5_SAGOE|nr:hypothetical protein P7K49_014991 [Saguinus oedipus]
MICPGKYRDTVLTKSIRVSSFNHKLLVLILNKPGLKCKPTCSQKEPASPVKTWRISKMAGTGDRSEREKEKSVGMMEYVHHYVTALPVTPPLPSLPEIWRANIATVTKDKK